MVSALYTLIKALPEVLALIKVIKEAAERAEKERKVKDDLNAIQTAFKTGDASKLSQLFGTRP